MHRKVIHVIFFFSFFRCFLPCHLYLQDHGLLRSRYFPTNCQCDVGWRWGLGAAKQRIVAAETWTNRDNLREREKKLFNLSPDGV